MITTEFERQILEMSNELTALKAAKVKSASTLRTTTATASGSFPLTEYLSVVVSTKSLELTLEFATDVTPLTMVTTTSAYSGRLFSPLRQYVDRRHIKFFIEPTVFTDADRQTVLNGGSVTVNGEFLVTSTADFTLTSRLVDSVYG